MPILIPELYLGALACGGIISTAGAVIYAQKQALSRRRLKRALIKHERNHARLLAAFSHDLRQPLQAAGMFAEILKERLTGTEFQPVTERLCLAIDSTGNLLSTLMDATSLNHTTITPKPIALAPFLQALFQQVEPRATAKPLRFLLHTVDRVITSDAILLERLIRNLLINAITYTPSGGVLLGCRLRHRQVGIQIVDTGIGIAEENLDQIFDDFIRVTPHGAQENLGLGLGIARRAAQLLGHRLEVKSKLGKGSSFTVWVDLPPQD